MITLNSTKYKNNTRTVSGVVTVYQDDVILLCDTSLGAVTINLAAIPADYFSTQYKLYVKDNSGNAAVNNITIVPPAGVKINNAANYIVSLNNDSLEIIIGSNLDYLVIDPSSCCGGSGSSSVSSNTIYAGPIAGPPAVPTFRPLVLADIPDLSSVYWKLGGNTLTGTQNFGTISAHDVPIVTSNIERARYTAGGKFGFGIVAPVADFEIHGTSVFMLGSSVLNPAVSAASQGGTLFSQYTTTAFSGLPVIGGIMGIEFGVIANPTSDIQYFGGVSTVYYDQSIGTVFNAAPIEPASFVGHTASVRVNSSNVTIDKISGYETVYTNYLAGSTINHSFGFYAAGISASLPNLGTTNNYYAFYAEDQTGHPGVPANRWGVYVADVVSNNFFAGAIGIGVATPAASAILDLTSADKALLISRVANSAAVATPVDGMIIYDIAAAKFKGYEAGAWVNLI